MIDSQLEGILPIDSLVNASFTHPLYTFPIEYFTPLFRRFISEASIGFSSIQQQNIQYSNNPKYKQTSQLSFQAFPLIWIISLYTMKQVKKKSFRNQIAQTFRQKCKQQLKQQPKNYLLTALKENLFSLDLSLLAQDELMLLQIAFTLPINKIHLFLPEPEEGSPNRSKGNGVQIQSKLFHETPKFKELLHIISNATCENPSLRTLHIERIPISLKNIKQLSQGLKQSKTLRQLSLSSCNLSDDHLQSIKASIAENESLITLDLSRNNLVDVGGMIGHILSQHSRRRSELIWLFNLRGEVPVEDISNTGLCEINLERNQLNDKSVIELASFLKNDTWTKCLNLKGNRIQTQGIRQFAMLLKNNASLVSLDLRQNEGLTKQYSRYIYKKLVLNMQRYKQKRQQIEKNKIVAASQQRSQVNSNTDIREFNQGQNNLHNSIQFKSLRQGIFQPKYTSKQYSTIFQAKKKQRNNLTEDRKNEFSIPQSNVKQSKKCQNCKQKTFEYLKLQKKNLDLQLNLKKVRQMLLNKNIDISSILPVNPPPQNGHGSLTELLSIRSNENDDQLLQRMQQIMFQLTRIMQNIEEQQHTKQNMSNPLDNPNSFSNTIQLYPHNSHLHELSKQIEEDRLQSILQVTSSLSRKVEYESNL